MKKLIFFLLLFWSVNTNAQITCQWGREGRKANSEAYSCTSDKDGNVFGAGYYINYDTLNFGGHLVFDTSGALGKDMFVVKSDSLGNYKWAITTRNIRTMQVNPINMVTDKSGNLYIYGAFQPMGRGSFSFGSFTIQDSIFSEASFLAKISPTGTVLFLKNVMSGFVSGRMGIDDSDNIYISGHYSGTRVIGRDTLTSWPDYACFLGKFDSYGNRIWLKSIVGNAIYGYSVTANGTSYIQSSHSTTVVIGADTLLGSGFHMMKYNANGSLLWAKRLNLNTSYITTDKFENIYSTGSFTGTLILGRDTLRSHGGMDIYLSKADSSNNVIWTRSAGGLRNNIASGVEVDTFGNVLIYGGMMDNLGIDTINFDGIILIPSPLSSDPWFVAQYSMCGKFISALAINSGGDDANSISIPNKGSFYLFGDYIDTLVLANDTFISGPNRELPFIAKFRYNVYQDTMSSTLSGLDSVCKGASIILSSSLTSGSWLVTNGSASVVDGRVTGLNSGWDTILFTTRNACGVSASYKPIYIKESASAGIIIGPSSVCIGDTILLSNTVSGLRWLVTNTNAVFIGSSLIGLRQGIDSALFIATNSCGSDTSTKVITVLSLPNAGNIIGPYTLCLNDSVQLIDTVSGGVWSVVNNMVTDTLGMVKAISLGIDTILYVVTNSCGIAIATHTIMVKPLPDAGIISASDLCNKDTIHVFETQPGGTWSCSNINAIMVGSMLIGEAVGKETILYTVTNSCGIAVATHTIMVKPLPDPGLISARDICDRDTLQVSETQAGGNWSCSNSNAVIIGNSLVGLAPGVDTILYSLTNECGTSIASKTVIILPAPEVPVISRDGLVLSVPDVYNIYQWFMDGITIPGANTWKYKISELGNYSIKVSLADGCVANSVKDDVKDCSPASLMVYPNPTYSKVYIDWCKPVTVRMSVDDGKTFPAMPLIKEVDLTGLPNANYFLAFYDENGNKIGVKQVTKMGR